MVNTPEPDEPQTVPGRRRLLEWFPTEFRRESYPNDGPIAVAARALFLLTVIAVGVAALGPHQFKPRIVGHYHLQRFAAWYLVTALAAAALPRTRLRLLGLFIIAFAIGAELVRALPAPWSINLRDNVYADIGGVYALLFPLALARWRSAVRARPS